MNHNFLIRRLLVRKLTKYDDFPFVVRAVIERSVPLNVTEKSGAMSLSHMFQMYILSTIIFRLNKKLRRNSKSHHYLHQ